MITRVDLQKTAREYLDAAMILRDKQKYDVSVYLCGYAVEIALKDRTCETLHWLSFPDEPHEFKGLSSFKTHNLEMLLHLSGIEDQIKPALAVEWSTITKWDPEQRYSPRGTKTQADADDIIAATQSVLAVIL